MSDIERRFTLFPVEARTRAERRTIGGYAAVFNRESQNLGGFVEVVMPTAFNKSRGDGWPGVVARYNHDDNMMLGRTSSGTLRLSVDDTGLNYDVDPPTHRGDVVELVERGDVTQSSFAFRLIEDDWGLTEQGFTLRRLIEVGLVDVAPVNLPAYVDSTVGVRTDIALRSLAEKMDAPIEDIVKLAADNELRKLFVRSDGGSAKPDVKTYGPAALLEVLAKQDPAV